MGSAAQGNYSIFKDVNGDGYVPSSDGLLVLGLGNSLPAKPRGGGVPGGGRKCRSVPILAVADGCWPLDVGCSR